MKVLVVDVGGTNVKVLATGHREPRKIPSGPGFTAVRMVEGVKQVTGDWEYDAVTIGYPGPVRRGRPFTDPVNLGRGWLGFNFRAAFGCPVQIINDAAMQALGSFQGGKMLFLGLGTGMGSALVVEGIVVPMELGHLPYKKSTFEDYVGTRGLIANGTSKWRRYVTDVVGRLFAALQPDYIVLGGGNVKKLKELPPHCRLGKNSNAFRGGFRVWEEDIPGHAVAAGKGHK